MPSFVKGVNIGGEVPDRWLFRVDQNLQWPKWTMPLLVSGSTGVPDWPDTRGLGPRPPEIQDGVAEDTCGPAVQSPHWGSRGCRFSGIIFECQKTGEITNYSKSEQARAWWLCHAHTHRYTEKEHGLGPGSQCHRHTGYAGPTLPNTDYWWSMFEKLGLLSPLCVHCGIHGVRHATRQLTWVSLVPRPNARDSRHLRPCGLWLLHCCLNYWLCVAKLIDCHSSLDLLDDKPPLDASWVMGMKHSGCSVAFPRKASSSLAWGSNSDCSFNIFCVFCFLTVLIV